MFFVGVSFGQKEDGHFSSWDEVPEMIDRFELEGLHKLTRVKLGYRQSSVCLSDEDHLRYMHQTQKRWQEWWKSTGDPISKLKDRDAKVDEDAFGVAWKFFGAKKAPTVILPVWIPATWTLRVTFSNGDYMGREKEVWVLERKAQAARLTKLRGDYAQPVGDQIGWGPWTVTLSEFAELTPEDADQVLKALCYVHRYAPPLGSEVVDDQLERLYYPHSTLHLLTGDDRILWNTEGYEFNKTEPEHLDGDSGRSYYFLRTVFSDKEKWKVLTEPTSDQLGPYRKLLSLGKPYLFDHSSEIVQLFGQCGGELEQEALFEWAEKQKAATDPNMGWELCCDDFGTGLKENVISQTRLTIQDTLMAVKEIGDRSGEGSIEWSDQAKELEIYIAEMLALKKREEEAELQAHPQPLRDLIAVSDHPEDPDLKHLSAAVQKIRSNPDPELFEQLVKVIDDGTVSMRRLLEYILLNDHDLLAIDPWGEDEEGVAIEACIDALPYAKKGGERDLVEMLLRQFGGGEIEFEGKEHSYSVGVERTENGYRTSSGGASDPLSMKDAQKELRRLYSESKSE